MIENSFIHERLEDVDIVRVFGEVDLASTGELEAAIASAQRPGHRIVVDLLPCTYIDSTGIATLIRAHRAHTDRFGIVVPDSGAVHRVFAITSLLRHLPVVTAV